MGPMTHQLPLLTFNGNLSGNLEMFIIQCVTHSGISYTHRSFGYGEREKIGMVSCNEAPYKCTMIVIRACGLVEVRQQGDPGLVR
jgi:hypothetical protein